MADAQKKILVVDDEPDVRTFFTTLLEDNGYDVITANDGEEGFEKAKKDKPDLITLDISMPKESGIRMYRDLVDDAETVDIPVVIVTGVSKDMKGFIYGRKKLKPPASYFEKPIEEKKFLETIKGLL